MPQIIPAVAAAVSWVSSAAAAASAAVVGWMATPFVMAMGEGAAIAMASGVLKVAATALGSYALNAVMAPKVGGGGSPTQFKADPQSPIRGVMGRFGTSGTQAHMRVWGKNNLMISYMVILSLGPIQGVEKFTANGLQVNFPGPNGLAANVEPYKDKMWMTYKNGLPTDGSLMPPPTGGTPTMEWTGNHKTSGYAGAFWTMQNNSKRASYEGGVPKPVWTLNGMLCYDPRLDSTQIEIGGSGPHRVDDWRTWTYSQNPQIHAINWALGHYKKLPAGIIDRNFLLAGIGAPITSIHLPSLVAGANVSDANGWKICGEWNTQDDKWNTFASMLQAGGSAPIHVGAKIGIMTNAPRVPVATITDEDVTGNLNIKVMAPSRDRFNTIYPMYISEPNGWEYATAGAVTSTVYQAEDGGEERSKEMKYNFVGQSKQARELAAYDLANTRETMKLAFPAKPYLIGVRAGDAVNVDMPRRGIVGKFIVLARPLELGEGAISFELRSETDAKHPWALGQTDQPAPSPSLSPFDPSPAPPEGWTVDPRPADEDGSQQPSLVVTGEVPDGIGSVVFEVSKTSSGPWRQIYSGPPTTEQITVDGLSPNEQYWVGVTYYSVDGKPSDRTVYGPYTSPSFIASESANVTFPDGTSPIWNYDTFADLPTTPSANQLQAYVKDEQKLYSWDDATASWVPMVADAEIPDGSLTNIKFASGLRAAGLGPVLPALPSAEWPEGAQFVLTTDGETYTVRGGAWSSSIAADQIAGQIADANLAGIAAGKITGQLVNSQIGANAIANGNIAAGAVTGTKIAAGAVTTSKLSVVPFNLWPYYGFEEGLTGWNNDDGAWDIQQSGDGNAAGQMGVKAAVVIHEATVIPAGQQRVLSSSLIVNIQALARYRIRVPVMNSMNRVVRFGIHFYRRGPDGDQYKGSDWTDINPSTFTTIDKQVQAPADANAYHIQYVVSSSSAAKAGWLAFGAPVITEAAGATAIIDGAVIADKIAANAITAGKVAAGAINTDALSARSVTVSKLAVVPDNLNPDPAFLDNAFWGGIQAGGWFPEDGTNGQEVGIYGRYYALWQDLGAFTGVKAKYTQYLPRGSVKTGQRIRCQAAIRNLSNANVSVAIECLSATGAWLGGAYASVPPFTSNAAAVSPEYPVPAGTVDARFVLIADVGAGTFSGSVIVGNIYGHVMNTAEMIVDGAITANKVAANAITAGKIAAGAVTANAIAADSITARHLVLSDKQNVIPDADFRDLVWWKGSHPVVANVIGLDHYWTTNGRGIDFAAGQNFSGVMSSWVPVEQGASYRVEFRAWVNGGTGQFRPLIHAPNWAWISLKQSAAVGTAAGWASESMVAQDTYVGPTDSSVQSFVLTIPTGLNLNQIQFRFDGALGTSGAIFTVRMTRMANANLLVDGSVTAGKVAANAITSDKIVAGAVTAAKINVTQLSAITADMGIITAGMIRSGTTGMRTEIDKNGGRSYHANGQLAVRWGIW